MGKGLESTFLRIAAFILQHAPQPSYRENPAGVDSNQTLNPRHGDVLLTRLRMEKWPQMSPVVDQTSGSFSGKKQQSRFMKLTMIRHVSS